MKSFHRLGWFNTRVITCLFALGIVLFTGATVQAAPQFDLTCSSCHQMPPLDSPAGVRDPVTSSVKGNHQTHAGPAGTTCVKCHGGPQTTYDHRDKLIQMQGNINNSPAGAKYSRVFFNQTSIPPVPLGTCSNVNCHFESVTPEWGSSRFTATADCNKCHNYTTISSAGHSKHVAKFSCDKCHSDHTADAEPFAHATSAGKRAVNITFGKAPNNGIGSYSDTSIDFLPSQTHTYGTCSTLYCHSSGQSANGASATPAYATTPVWNGVATCASCHATSATLSTGSHSQHLKVDNNCDYCHSGAYLDTTYDSPNHINRQIDVSSVGYNAGGAPGNGYGTCSTAICHGSIKPFKTWGANNPGTHTCTKCHGTPSTAAFANISANHYVFAPATSVAGETGQVGTAQNSKVGAHQTHLRYLNGVSQQGNVDSRCSSCHGPLPTNNLHAVSLFIATKSSDPSDTFNGLASTSSKGAMSPLPVYGFYSSTSVNKSCNNIYCHNPAGSGGTLAATNNGTSVRPTWVDASYISEGTLKNDLNCNRCHKSPNGSNTISTKQNHVGFTIGTACTPCHGHEGRSGGAIGKQHIDGVMWGQGGPCSTCHGYESGSWTPAPVINAEGKGAHEKHITYLTTKRFTINLNPDTDQYAGSTASWTNVCGICHGNTPTNHMNDTVTVALDQAYVFGSGTATYTGIPGTPSAVTAKSCSNIGCHSSGQSADGLSAEPVYAAPVWIGTRMTCGSCHKASPTELVTGSHSQHLKIDNNCDYCHSGAYLDTAYDSQKHINNLIDVSSVGYNAGGAPGNGYGTCATAICHGSIVTLKTWGTNTLPGTDACTKCHGTPTVGTVTAANRQVIAPADPAATDIGKVSTTNARTGAHQTHLLFSNGLKEKGSVDDNCSACHGSPLPSNSMHAVSLFVASQSSDPTATFSGLATNNGTMSPSPVFDTGATRSCSNTYCHNPAGGGGTLASTNAGTNVSPVWTDASYIADGTLKNDINCNRCHKSPNGSNIISATYNHSSLTIANSCVKCHEHDGGLGGAVGRQHIDGTRWGQVGADGCVSCHGYGAGTWTDAASVNPGGKGAHEAHITYLTTKRFATSISLSPLTDQYAGSTDAWTKVCGICHGTTAGNHGTGGGNGTVNVALDQGYFFGSTGAAQYNGAPGGPVANKTCSNLSCHYFTTPQWSN